MRYEAAWGPQSPPSRKKFRGLTRFPALGLPETGNFAVDSNWRELMLSAITVGRDVSRLVKAVPGFSVELEAAMRCAPLRAYLTRKIVYGDPALITNKVYRDFTEITGKAAFAYRIGMTMAEWLCRHQLGMAPSVHGEDCPPAGASPTDWEDLKSKPDLVGSHPTVSPGSWVIEAKGKRKLTKGALNDGAAQLTMTGVRIGNHLRVLCGTGLEHSSEAERCDRVYMTLDLVNSPPISGPPKVPSVPISGGAGPSASTVTNLVASSMIIYYLLANSLERGTALVVPVAAAPPADEQSNHSRGTKLRPLEQDISTQQVREGIAVTSSAENNLRLTHRRIDMLTTDVGDLGLMLGMSRRLFNACAEYDGFGHEMGMDGSWPLPDVLDTVLAKVYTAEEGRWEIAARPRLPTAENAASSLLESASDDLYIALDMTDLL